MIKAIIFDADGPLYHRSDDAADKTRKLLQEYGCSNMKSFEETYEKEKLKGYDAEETPAEMFRNTFASTGSTVSLEQAKEFARKFDIIHSQVVAAQNALKTLEQLKRKGYLICVLTDSFYSAEAKWQWFERIGLKQYINDIVSSVDIKRLKDSAEAYLTCLDILHVSASEAIFVGHQQYEMDGAKAAHVKSIAILPIAAPDIHADYSVDALTELPSLLARLNNVSS